MSGHRISCVALGLAATLLAPLAARAEDPQQTLLRDLDLSMTAFDSQACGASSSFGSAAVLLGAGALVASNTKKGIRSTWGVILFDAGAVSALDGMLLLVIPDNGASCAKRYSAMPAGTPEERAARIAAGQGCLQESDGANRTYRYASAGTRLAVAGGVVALWATDPPEPHDTTLLVIGGLTVVGAGLGVVFPSRPEGKWERHQELVKSLSASPTVLRDRGGALLPALALGAAF